MEIKKGLFITFEGQDGCGKSTIINEVFKKLNAIYPKKILVTREPGGANNPIGEKIRQIILNKKSCKMTPITEALLFAASRAQHINDFIRPSLMKNNIILCDRFIHSSFVYQGYINKIEFKKISDINKYALNKLWPNLVFLLLTEPKICLKRINGRKNKKNRFDLKSIDEHKNIYKGYLEITKKYPENLIVIDGKKTIKKNTDLIVKTILTKIKTYDK